MHQAILDFVGIFNNQDRIPIFLNDVDVSTIEGKQSFNEKIMTLYEEESLTSSPTCQCRYLRGGKYHKDVCPRCNTPCEYELEKEIENDLWVRAPEGIVAFINPDVYVMFQDFMTKGPYNLLQYLINPAMKNDGRSPWFNAADKHGIPRGLNNFITHFDDIMATVFTIVRNDRRRQIPVIQEFITAFRDKLFTPYLIVPNRMAFVIENNEYNKWADKTIETGVNAILTIVSADTKNNGKDRSIARKEALVATALQEYGDFWINFFSKVAGKKHGHFRQEVFGQRSHFTFRGVITSITARHNYDDCILPWRMGVQLFKDHIIAKLMRGTNKRVAMSPKDAERLINFSVNNHVPLVDEILKELIAEHPSGRGLPIILQRNPSLKRGSAQQLWIPRIKTDLNDFTIGLSVLILGAFNADFDGDQMNGYFIVDGRIFNILCRLHPSTGVMDLNHANEISANLDIPKPLTSTVDNWIHMEEEYLMILDGDIKPKPGEELCV